MHSVSDAVRVRGQETQEKENRESPQGTKAQGRARHGHGGMAGEEHESSKTQQRKIGMQCLTLRRTLCTLDIIARPLAPALQR